MKQKPSEDLGDELEQYSTEEVQQDMYRFGKEAGIKATMEDPEKAAASIPQDRLLDAWETGFSDGHRATLRRLHKRRLNELKLNREKGQQHTHSKER